MKNGLTRINKEDGGVRLFDVPTNRDNLRPNLRPTFNGNDVTSIAQLLQEHDYVTAHFGKYHVGNRLNPDTGVPNDNNLPLDMGFDHNFGGTQWGTPSHTNGYFTLPDGTFDDHIGPELDDYAVAPNDPGCHHLSCAMRAAAIDFLEDPTSELRDDEYPFFMHFSPYAVHTPIRDQGDPNSVVDYYELKQDGQNHKDPDYAALVEGIDKTVDQIMTSLMETPDPRWSGKMLYENSLVVFYSDNGPRVLFTNSPALKGQKGELDEGGIRVPMIAFLKDRIPSGTQNDTPVTSVDFYKTVADLAGIDVSGIQKLDGESLVPIMEDPNDPSLSSRAIYWHFPGYLVDNFNDEPAGNPPYYTTRNARPRSVIRKGNHKLIYNYENEENGDPVADILGGVFELYDVGVTVDANGTTPNDIGETQDLAVPEQGQELPAEIQDIIDDLADELATFLFDTGAEMPMILNSNGKRVDFPGQLTADMDADGDVDFDDADDFNLALFDDSAYRAMYGVPGAVHGDADRDGDLDFDDIDDFNCHLANSAEYCLMQGAALTASARSVPEPGTLVLAGIGLFTLLSRSRLGRRGGILRE